MNIAFCINRLGIIGLGVTISSLIRNCSKQGSLKIWFLCACLTPKEKNQIIKLLKSEHFSGNYDFIDFDPVFHFGTLSSLHGDWTAYGRLLLSDFIYSDQVLYLDSDLVVELDVLEVEDFNFNGHALAAVGGGRFRYTLGNKFYINKLGISPDVEYFNSGVLLFNLKEWRRSNIKERCLLIANKYPLELPSHDQSLLNLFCLGNFAKLPECFNCEWLAHLDKPNVASRMILHFVGSPKPWDPFGFILNNGYPIYREYLNSEWYAAFGGFTSSALGRAWNIRRSYLRCISSRIKVKSGSFKNT